MRRCGGALAGGVLVACGACGMGCEAAGGAAAGIAAVNTAGAVANAAGAVVVGTAEFVVDMATLGQLPKPEPTTELSRQEQVNLLDELNRNPKKLQNLTLRERRFLGKMVIAEERRRGGDED